MDRAALDVALRLGIPCGGWCPAGRLAEDGAIPESYPLKCTPTDEYAQRTEWNVRDSDGTLVLTWGQPTGGTAFTIDCARRLGKPYCVVDLARQADVEEAQGWIAREGVRVLNVAGPRESTYPGAYEGALALLDRLFLTA